jgi:ATP-dependent helicase HepA
LIKRRETRARADAPEILASAHRRSRQTLDREINRLRALRELNPNVRDEEIEFFEQQQAKLDQLLDSASLRLDAIRVIVST